MTASPPLGLIINPAARRVRHRDLGPLAFWRGLLPEHQVRVTRTLAELDQAVAEFRDAGHQVVAILGGDGTLHRVAEALVTHHHYSPLPLVLALAGGTMNGLSRWFSSDGPPERVLARALGSLRSGVGLSTRSCHLLRVEDRGSAAEHYGFGFGVGLVVRAFEEYYRSPEPGLFAAIRAASLPLRAALMGGSFYRPLRLEVAVAGAEWLAEPHTVIASVTDNPVLWFRPFGAPLGEADAFHLAATAMRPGELALRLWSLFRGRCRHPRLRVGQVDQASLRGEGGYLIDGELYRSAAGIDLSLSTGPRLRFLMPPASG